MVSWTSAEWLAKAKVFLDRAFDAANLKDKDAHIKVALDLLSRADSENNEESLTRTGS